MALPAVRISSRPSGCRSPGVRRSAAIGALVFAPRTSSRNLSRYFRSPPPSPAPSPSSLKYPSAGLSSEIFSRHASKQTRWWTQRRSRSSIFQVFVKSFELVTWLAGPFLHTVRPPSFVHSASSRKEGAYACVPFDILVFASRERCTI